VSLLNRVNVLITGIGSAGVGEQILKALKISDLDLFIIGTDISKVCFNKNKVDKFLVVPSVSDDDYGKYIRAVIDNNNIKAIFPGSEAELKYYSNNISEFKDVYISINNRELIDLCLNKFNTYEKFSQLGIFTAKYNKINTVYDGSKIDYFPVVLKPNTNSGGSSHIYVAFDKEEVEMFVKYMLKHEIDVIAQEYIEYDNNEYTIGVSSDREGNILGSIILKRLINNALSTNKKIKFDNKSVIISSGISQGEFINDENIKRQAEDIAKKLGSKGPMNIQARFSNNKLLLLEINPRLSGTTYLRAMVGYNEPSNMIKQNILHENVNYKYDGRIVLRSITEIEN
jgi:carbamoyl-phosphate synthase large subunit